MSIPAFYSGTGRRKTAIARVRLLPGEGEIVANARTLEERAGISMDPDVRFTVAMRIVERAADHGIPRSDVVVDPLVMPIGALAQAGQQVFALVRRLREELRVNTTCGASNVSFGLPNREGINAAFLPMAIAAGMTSAITNPLLPEVKASVMAADVLMGHGPPPPGRLVRGGRTRTRAR